MPAFSFDEYAEPIINFLLQTFANDIDLLSIGPRRSLQIAETGTPIDDLNGKPLFIHYDIIDEHGNKVGAVRASGRKDKLPPIDAIIVGEGALDPKRAHELVSKHITDNYPGMQATDLGFLCYSYPRIGLLHKLTSLSGTTQLVLHDAFTGALIQSVEGSDRLALASDGDSGTEGQGIYSMDDFLPQSGPGDGARKQWAALAALALKANVKKHGLETNHEDHASIFPAVHGVYIPIRLRPQETPVYCAVATAQMILGYLGIQKTQTEIAVALRTGPNGTTRSNFAYGLENLLPKNLSTRSDSTVTFDEVCNAINQSLPIKSGIPYHARLINGVRIYEFIEPHTGQLAFRDRYYLVNDPYPPGIGQFSMENASNPFDIFEDIVVLGLNT